jgi:hypothetical protein
MRQVTRKITAAFYRGDTLRIGNTRTNGRSIWLHDNKIVDDREDGIYISNAGWKSNTTKERLNAISDVNIVQRNFVWYLNGHEWNGEWTKVRNWAHPYLSNAVVNEPIEEIEEFDSACEWVKSGYSKPIYSVYETLNESELTGIEEKLTNAGIKSKRMESDTVGVYKIHHFVIVHPSNHAKAITL